MRLETWKRETGGTYSALAKSIGISAAYLTEIAGGKKSPSLAVAVAIQQATDGQVTCSELLVQPEVA